MRAKIQKNANMLSRCSPDREQEGKDTFFFDLGGRFLDRWCSSSLVLFPSAIYSCQGDLENLFYLFTQVKSKPKQPTWCCEPTGLGLQTCIQPDVLHASLHHLHADLRKPKGL